MSLGVGQVTILYANRYIRNVNGSSGDPHLEGYNDWISPWKDVTNNHGALSCCVCGNPDGDGSRKIIGGHIVLGHANDVTSGAAVTNALSLTKGCRVFIAPICKDCNGKGYGNLWVTQSTYIIQLCGFMEDITGKNVEIEYVIEHPFYNDEYLQTHSGAKVDKYRKEMYKEFREKKGKGLNLWDYVYLGRSDITQVATVSIASSPSGFSSSSRSYWKDYGYDNTSFKWY